MCGIVGIHSPDVADHDLSILHPMVACVSHRGPDNLGFHTINDENISLGHTRLAIIDPSTEANQPMASQNKSLWITFNGEIYNHKQLRNQLTALGHKFHTTSDTEVVLNAYEEWGPECLFKFRGMFAFGLWDTNKKTLFIARDRVGIKPLYYYWDPNRKLMILASEIKSILMHPKTPHTLDHSAIYDYLTYGYIPAPKTTHLHINKLRPATYLTLKNGELRSQSYWDVPLFNNYQDISDQQATEQINQKLIESVETHMVSDVPVGSFLSGGLDSSVVSALASRINPNPLKTYTILFRNQVETEIDSVNSFRKNYATNHSSLAFEKVFSRRVLERLCDTFDEPLGGISVIPTLCVSLAASKDVKVALSGDGGDEIFGGYYRYQSWMRHHWLEKTPRSWLTGLSKLIGAKASKNTSRARWASYLDSTPLERYSRLVTRYNREQKETFLDKDWLSQFKNYDELWCRREHWKPEIDPITRAQYLDFKTYLPNKILVKVDKASMSTSLEVRPPLLDHELIELMFSIAPSKRWDKDNLKSSLKKSVSGLLEPETLSAKKIGFGVPKQSSTDILNLSYELIGERRHKYESQKIFASQFHDQHDLSKIPWDIASLILWLNTL